MLRALPTSRSLLRRTAFAAAMLVSIAGCDIGGGGGADSLASLPLDGTIGASGAGAARSSTGHYFVQALDGALSTVRLVPGGARWEVYGVGYGTPTAPQHDGSIFVLSAGGGSLMQVVGAEYVDVRAVPAVGATFLAKTEDGRLHMVSATVVSAVNSSYTFWSALPGDATWRNDGSGTMPTAQLWMTSKGRVFGWRRNFGVVLVDRATVTQTTVVACGQPGASAIDCPSLYLSALPDRRGGEGFRRFRAASLPSPRCHRTVSASRRGRRPVPSAAAARPTARCPTPTRDIGRHGRSGPLSAPPRSVR